MKNITNKRKNFYKKVAQKRKKNFVLVLEDLHDPHNLAAIFRSADAFGIQKIYLIFEKQNAINPQDKVFKKTSAFTNKWLDFEIFSSTEKCLKKLRSEKYTLISTILDKEAQSFFETNFTKFEKIALIIGNEHCGISETVKKITDKKIYIPMQGFAESLNVSVASAICLSEISRQRSDSKFSVSEIEEQKLIKNFKEKQLQYGERIKERKRLAIEKAKNKKP